MTEQYGRLDGKIAIVTGGTQGLGATIANLFAERGAKGVVICGRNVAKGEAKAEQIRKATGAQVLYVEADLEKVEDARKVVSACDATFGRVDALVNAAAITDRGTILDTSPELFDRMFAVNVRAPFFLMQEAVKLMRREGTQGTIVNIGSMSAMAGQPFIAAYCSSKGALETLTKNTSYALLRNRIRVNGLNIGWMASEGEDRIQREFHGAADDWLEKAAASQPFGRLVDPKEVARACAYLSSDESGLMTGSVICFDQSVWGGYDGSPHPVAPL
ncbi:MULTISPECIES: SDR family oxidoreductase [Ensifer]|jgi:NAD(P)-dependent dehydrogenase (short-subunit alcohol dehydrogenase family)|uniref:SDR family oxidoreductase n=1 Tax=Ensifer canadensis TaxID=555315 RepID=A0AAW4FTD0_9HYPH|nr:MULTISPECIES: SDR family oxidoreductase [Ensifer]AHK44525.1 3-oxoacyl-[acyl-carrier-protein] reductase [Ensifer adhaerens OV14]MDP9630659.1 NAD(P)-dependent dehydrogenase (short-subunit alcohol dehydrogenase family) [Ensifer adhaerens]KQU86045.1 short-chain dehydrogenase [Ensifer sp. Root31]KQW58874.1 short-chain dehydrogenase [Ensifer sp. Root1252]KQW74579.1 short-chain dehydrogenase [Ensifer sp. Root127]